MNSDAVRQGSIIPACCRMRWRRLLSLSGLWTGTSNVSSLSIGPKVISHSLRGRLEGAEESKLDAARASVVRRVEKALLMGVLAVRAVLCKLHHIVTFLRRREKAAVVMLFASVASLSFSISMQR